MEECRACGNSAYIFALPVNYIFCKDHKNLHKDGEGKDHQFKMFLIRLGSEQFSKVSANLLLKLSKTSDCRRKIIKITEGIIAEIQGLCAQALKTFKDKEQYYLKLLKESKQTLRIKDIKEIEEQLNTTLLNYVPIQNFYRYSRIL